MAKSDQSRPSGSTSLALKIPPLALTGILAALMWALTAGMPLSRMGASHAALVASIGLAICFAGVLAFRQSQTTIDPRTPTATSSLVVTGIYHYTRNPIYLGFLLVLLALALYLVKLTALVLLSVSVVYLNEFQIKPEESALRARFGAGSDILLFKLPRITMPQDLNLQTLTLPVSGMDCGGCVRSVDKAPRALPGVSEVQA